MSQGAGLVVLISGRGSNMSALACAFEQGLLPEPIKAVISDRSNAAGLNRAAEHGIDHVCIDRSNHQDQSSFEVSLSAAIDGYAPRYVVMAGFMRVLSADFVNQRLGRMINIHPSLLPKHRGLHTHRNVLAAGEDEHGSSVHFVTPALDGGPVISQARISVQANDTPDTLAARLLPIEHRLLVQTTALLLRETVVVRDEKIYVNNHALESPLDLQHDFADLGVNHQPV